VRIFSLGKTGQELTISILGPKDIFGELALLDRKPHSATVVTLTETTVWMRPIAIVEDWSINTLPLARDESHVGQQIRNDPTWSKQ
jgi:CRP-like cAMP-binding protein